MKFSSWAARFAFASVNIVDFYKLQSYCNITEFQSYLDREPRVVYVDN